MRRSMLSWLSAFIVAVVAGATTAVAQDRPDFAGVWEAVTIQIEGRDWEPVAEERMLKIQQDERSVTISGSVSGGGRELVYYLDGTSVNRTSTVAGQIWTRVSRAQWVGLAIMIPTTVVTDRGYEFGSLVIYSFDSNGRLRETILAEALGGRRVSVPQTTLYEKQS